MTVKFHKKAFIQNTIEEALACFGGCSWRTDAPRLELFQNTH